MKHDYLDILRREIEIPDAFQDRMEKTFAEIQHDGRTKKSSTKSHGRKNRASLDYEFASRPRLPKAAVILLACFLVSGITVAAANMLNAYWQRMEDMEEEEVEHFYEVAGNAETTLYSRELTDEEQARYETLRLDYLSGKIFPENEIKTLAEGETYEDGSVALEEASRKIYLPQRTLTDEDILQIIDFVEKVNYSIEAVNQIGYGEEWRARMEEMTMEEVDNVYFTLYSNKCPVSGGYSRKLTDTEQQRYEELLTEYEENGMYTNAGCTVLTTVAECTGKELEICIQDGNYHLPDRELTDDELLLIIDWQHKGMYCLERINQEIDKGIRSSFPVSPYDLEPVDPLMPPA